AAGSAAAVSPTLAEAVIAFAVRNGGGLAQIPPRVAVLVDAVLRQWLWQKLGPYAAVVLLGAAPVGSLAVYSLGLYSTEREPDARSASNLDIALGNALNGPVGGLTRTQILEALTPLRGEWVLQTWEVRGEALPADPDMQWIVFGDDRC